MRGTVGGMWRRLLTVAAALSFTLCMATVALWVRSYARHDMFVLERVDAVQPLRDRFSKGWLAEHLPTTSYASRQLVVDLARGDVTFELRTDENSAMTTR